MTASWRARARTGRQPARGRGQSLAEFALVAPIFFLLVFSVIQLGILFGAQNNLVNAARDAARKAATYRVTEETYVDTSLWDAICDTIFETLRNDVEDYPGASSDAAFLTPTLVYEWEEDLSNPGNWFLVAHVGASYHHPLYVPLVSYFLDSSDGLTDSKLTLTASEQMRIENPSLATPATTPPSCSP